MQDYHGTWTYMNTLPVGTKFFVCNGYWHGEIVEENGERQIHVFDIDSTFKIDNDYDLSIIIEGDD